MEWRVARSLNVLLAQLNTMAPQRSRVSDGSIGDTNHADRTSDHNPWWGPGIVTARDITHDPTGGLDCNWLADVLIASRDHRIKYIIWNRRILAGQGGPSPWVWRTYTGTNTHTHHLHLSVVANPACDETQPWNLGGPPTGGFLMALSDAEQRFMHDRIKGFLRQRYYVVENGVAKAAAADTPGAIPAAALDSLDGDLLRRLVDEAQERANEAAAAAMSAASAAIAAASKVDQIAVGGIDLDVLVTRLADELDRRARDNDPTTGPRS